MLTSTKHALRDHLDGMSRWLLDLAFPPRCPSCAVAVSAQHNFCTACFAALKQISAPQCACCGIPFAFDIGSDAQCPECLTHAPHFDTARAPLVYDATSAPLIRALKFHDRTTGLARAVTMMQATLTTQRDAVDVIVPVPLHWRRLLRRHYNQSALLAFALGDAMQRPVMPGYLRRIQHTTPQMRLARAQRLKNVRHAFAVPSVAHAALAGKTVLLVDDVVTTGATVDACAAALKKAGAVHVHVVALARTVKE